MVGRTGARAEKPNLSTATRAAGLYTQAGWEAETVRNTNNPRSGVQMAAALVLEPIFEADLQPEQYAYRADRSALDALQRPQADQHGSGVWGHGWFFPGTVMLQVPWWKRPSKLESCSSSGRCRYSKTPILKAAEDRLRPAGAETYPSLDLLVNSLWGTK